MAPEATDSLGWSCKLESNTQLKQLPCWARCIVQKDVERLQYKEQFP